MTFLRGKEAQARRAAKAARAPNAIPKRLGKMAVSKRPPVSDTHRELVKNQKCLVTGMLSRDLVAAHHPDECFPMFLTAGLKISDYLVVPIAHICHGPEYPGSLHTVNNIRWWTERGINVYAWLRGFLRRHYPNPDDHVRDALKMIDKQEATMRPANGEK